MPIIIGSFVILLQELLKEDEEIVISKLESNNFFQLNLFEFYALRSSKMSTESNDSEVMIPDQTSIFKSLSASFIG